MPREVFLESQNYAVRTFTHLEPSGQNLVLYHVLVYDKVEAIISANLPENIFNSFRFKIIYTAYPRGVNGCIGFDYIVAPRCFVKHGKVAANHFLLSLHSAAICISYENLTVYKGGKGCAFIAIRFKVELCAGNLDLETVSLYHKRLFRMRDFEIAFARKGYVPGFRG